MWFNEAGAHLVEMVIASDEDWDRYGCLKWRTFDRWMLEKRADPEYETLVQFARESQSAHLKYECPLCDWGVFVLRLD